MAGKSRAGKIWRDLGVIDTVTVARHVGRIGGPGQPSTLHILFELGAPASIQLRKLPGDRATDRFISLGLQWRNGRQIGLSSDGFAIRSDIVGTTVNEARQRWRAGKYTVVISTSQWQEAPFALELLLFPLVQPRLVLSGRGSLDAIRRRRALQAQLVSRGGLRASLQPPGVLAPLGGRGRLRAGLQIIPTYRDPPPLGLGHVWFTRKTGAAGLLRVGAATGLDWETIDLPDGFPSYLPTSLSIDDFRFNAPRRTIFSERAYDVYGAYPELSVSPFALKAETSPDTPGVPYLDLTNGTHRREVLIGLPLELERCAIVHLEETLTWNNDVIRDLDDAIPLSPRLGVSNRRRSFAHRRRVSVFITNGTLMRRLQNPPSELLARLDAALPPLDTYLVERGVRVPGPSFSLPSLRILYPSFIAERRLPSPGDSVFGANPADRSSGLLTSYGMTRLLAADASMSSAAIYDTLANFPAIAVKPDYDPKATSFVIAQLSALPDGLTILSPWLRDGGYRISGNAGDAFLVNSDQLLRYGRWSGPLPARADTSVGADDPRWALAVQGLSLPLARLFRIEEPKLLLVYDWGLATYCREQLLLLGFSEDDLSPQPPERPQSYTLNPGRSRPLLGRGSLGLGTLKATKVQVLQTRLTGAGLLTRSDLSWCLRVRFRSRGGLRGALSLQPNLNIVRKLLLATLAGQGSLSRSDLSDARAKLVGRGSLGRPVLGITRTRPYLQLRATGRGRLVGRLRRSTIPAVALRGQGRLNLAINVAAVAPLGVAMTGRGRLVATFQVARLTGRGRLHATLFSGLVRNLNGSLRGQGLLVARLRKFAPEVGGATDAFGYRQGLLYGWSDEWRQYHWGHRPDDEFTGTPRGALGVGAPVDPFGYRQGLNYGWNGAWRNSLWRPQPDD